MGTFIKAKLIPDDSRKKTITPTKEVMINISSIIGLYLKDNKEYNVIVSTDSLQRLKASFYNFDTYIKEITATIEDESIFI